MKNHFYRNRCYGPWVALLALGGLLSLAGWPAHASETPHGVPQRPAGPRHVARTQAAVTYSEVGTASLPTLTFGARRVFYDADNDGDLDMLYQQGSTANTSIGMQMNVGGSFTINYMANSSGMFTSGPLNGITFSLVLQYASSPGLSVVDIDNDGDQDLVEYTNGAASRVIFNNGSSTSTLGSIASLPTLAFGTRHIFYDADNDGDQDILYQTTATNNINIFLQLNNGNGTFATAIAADATGLFSSGPLSGVTFSMILPGSSLGGLTPVDIDDDGDVDLMEHTTNVPFRFIYNNGSSPATVGNIASLPTMQFVRRIFVDVDSDGDQDFLYQQGTTANAGVGLQLSNSDGTFAPAILADGTGTFNSGPLSGRTFVQIQLSTSSPGLAGIDYDTDGDADLVEYTNSTAPRVIQQNGTRPLLISTAPADNATDVNPATNIVLTFDRSVVKGNGNIYLVRTSDNVVVETTPIGSTRVTGSGTTFTYDPGVTLDINTSYALRSDDEIVVDADGRAYFGIFNKTTYNFTTGAAVNTAPTDIQLSNNSVDENMAIGTAVGNFTSTDADVPAQTFTYTLVTGTGSTDNASFSLVGNQLRTAAMFDFETKTSYTVRVRTTDSGTPAATFDKVFLININNVNEAPVANNDVLSVFENSGAAVVSVLANDTDPDAGTTLTVTVVTQPANGTVTLTSGVVRFTPTTGFIGTTSFAYTISDGALTASATVTVTVVDNIPPTVAITSSASSPTVTSPIPVTVTFSESVSGFSAGGVTVSNGTVSGFSGSGTTYTFNVVPTAAGTVTVNIAANSASDAAGNNNTAAPQFSIIYQPVTSAPVVTVPANGSLLNTRKPTYTGTAPAGSTVIVYVDGSSIGSTTATSGSFSLLQPSNLADGTHVVRATAQLSGYVVSVNSNVNTFTVDATAPTVTITSAVVASGGTTGTSPIAFTVTFSESVTGFSVSSVAVSNGTLSSFSGGSGTTYTFNVTPTANGMVTVGVVANSASDAAGNGNTAATQYSFTYTQLVTTAPVVTAPANGSLLTTRTPTYTGTAPAGSTVVVYVDGSAIGSTAATGGNFSLVQPSNLADGSHAVRATAQLSGYAVSANSNTNTFTVDATAPTVAITSSASSPTSTSPIPVTVTFSESVTGFLASSVTVSNGTLSGFTAVSGTTYTFDITPTGTALVTVNVAANVAQDAAANGNTAAPQFSIQYNVPTATVASIARNTPSPTATTTVSYAVTFSGAVSGVTVSNFALTTTGAIAGSSIVSVSGSGAAYTVVISTGTGDGTLRLDVANATGLTPSVTNTPYTSGPAYTITKTFANPVLTIQGTGGTSGSVDVTAFVDVVQVLQASTSTVVANAVGNPSFETSNGLGNGNYGYSPTGASWTFNSRSGIAQNGSNFNSPTAPDGIAVGLVQTTTSPAVSGMLQQSLALTNGSYQVNFQAAQRNCCSTTMDQGINVFINNVFVGSITPANNNLYTSFTSSPFNVTAVAPTVAITSTAANPTSISPIPVTVTFSESVTGFSTSGITVTNGTLSGFSGSGAVYTFGVTPAGAGLVTVNVAANVAQNGVGTGNAAAPQFSITYQTLTAWTGATSTDWYTSGNWTGGVPTTTLDATIAASASRYPLVAAGTATVRSLTIDAGASFTQTGGTLDVRGDLTNNGTCQPTGGTVTMGTTARANGPNILGANAIRFWNLTVLSNGALLGTAAGASVQRVLTLSGTFVTQGSPFTLESNAAGTALVVNNGTNAVTGNVTVQRYILPDLNAGLGYRHFASAVGTATVASLATSTFTPVVNPDYNTSATPTSELPFPTVFRYDQARLATATNGLAAFDKGWASPGALTDPLTVGQGYTVNLAANQTLSVTGPLNNGTVPLALSCNSGPTAADAGWQLVGNPYPAPLDYSLVAVADRTNLDAAIYVFASDGRTAYTGTYRSYANSVGEPKVALGQGFFVRVTPGQTSGTLTLRNAHRVTAYQNPVYHRTAETRPLVQLDLQGNGSADPLYVYFESGATAGVDQQFDAVKMPNSTGLNLAAWAGPTKLAIEGLPLNPTASVTVPLFIGLPVTGRYTLHAAQLLNFGAGTQPFLRDLQLNTLTDLSLHPDYPFTMSATNTTPRFELVFGARVLGVASATLAAQVVVFPNPASKAVFVELPATLNRRAVTAALVDGLGRVVLTQVLPAGLPTYTLPLANVATGVYALRLQTEAGVVVKKLIVE